MRDDFYMNAKIRCKFGTNDTNGATQLCGHVFHVDIPRYSSNDIFKLLVASVHQKAEHDEHRDKLYAYFQRLREIIQHYKQHSNTMRVGIGICIFLENRKKNFHLCVQFELIQELLNKFFIISEYADP